MSKNTKNKKNADASANYDGVYAPKIKFPLYVYPETMKNVESLYKSDNCSTKTEFMEKAFRFYCAHLMQNKPDHIEYLAPQIAHIVEGYIMGTEQRLFRAIFKLAVEVGAQSHILAAINDIEDSPLFKLREMVTDEVRRINGIINFESTVSYQRSEEE